MLHDKEFSKFLSTFFTGFRSPLYFLLFSFTTLFPLVQEARAAYKILELPKANAMLKGLLKALDENGMERIHRSALAVLERTGLRIRGRFLLEALADGGCRVDFGEHRAWFKPDLVEKQIAAQRGRYKMVRSSLWYPFCRELPADDVAVPEEFICDYGFGTPTIYDYPTGRFLVMTGCRSRRRGGRSRGWRRGAAAP